MLMGTGGTDAAEKNAHSGLTALRADYECLCLFSFI